MGVGDARQVRSGGIRVADPIVERLARLEEYVKLLEGLRGRELADAYARLSLERAIHLAAEASLDAAEMLISRRGWRKPENYKDVVRVLAEHGVLPTDFAREFEGVASLRNLLVHDYTRIDHLRLQAYLGRLSEFRQFARHMSMNLVKGGE